MATFEPSPETNSSPLTSCAEVSPARISARPENAPELKALAQVFGLNSPALLGLFDLDTCSLRTLQACLFTTEYAELSENLPDSGMWDCGAVYELQNSEPPICESACSLWPTAKAKEPQRRLTDGRNISLTTGEEFQVGLEQTARIWPTPQQHDQTGARGKNFVFADHHYSPHDLTMAADLWRTPDTPGSGGPRNRQNSIGNGHQITIAEQAEHWPTVNASQVRQSTRTPGTGGKILAEEANNWANPTVQDSANNAGPSQWNRNTDPLNVAVMRRFNSHQAPLIPDGPPSSEPAPTSRRRLNPRFVEWLMGFPIGWTEL